ncbi:membrane integrity-associated transporter subunit PqiC [Loktanella sp. 3ANDIMAR09]|uniref:PqiC family protein n=1 Tax=Loktanella sp. 3ANDIMAR09 TaxID=1225657 RepID=UPI000A4BE24D|nr:ABC-type transport auxiliary lipoprotein family protein [Loktanella sp. 3ANDIMAR09]
MTMKPALIALGVAALAACSTTTTRLSAPVPPSALNLTAGMSTVVLRDVTLPAYAASEEIALETAPGVITSDGDLLSADDPGRGVTLALARQMDDILSAVVGPEPWPFPSIPDVVVDVRVTDMLGSAVTGTYRLSGQYFIGGDGIDYPNSAQAFDYVIPMSAPDQSGAVAAQGVALTRLAEDIARRLGR